MLLPSVTNRHSKLWSECIADRPTSAESQSEEEQGPRHLTSLNPHVKILGPNTWNDGNFSNTGHSHMTTTSLTPVHASKRNDAISMLERFTKKRSHTT
jgi:hypothetical protein